MPFKSLDHRRHHIPKQRHRVTNWAAYDAGLRGRGSLTIWFTEAAIATWRAEPRTTRGGQPHYFEFGDNNRHDAASRLPLGIAPNRGIDRIHHRTARP